MKMTIEERIGGRLRDLREDRSLSLKDVAMQTGISISNLSRIETGKQSFSIGTLSRICDVLGAAVDVVDMRKEFTL